MENTKELRWKWRNPFNQDNSLVGCNRFALVHELVEPPVNNKYTQIKVNRFRNTESSHWLTGNRWLQGLIQRWGEGGRASGALAPLFYRYVVNIILSLHLIRYCFLWTPPFLIFMDQPLVVNFFDSHH